MDYSIVIPVYNTVHTLPILYDRLKTVFTSEGKTWELIFVNDHSPNPESWKQIKLLADQYPEVVGIQLTRNFGQQAATLCGFEHVRGAYVITMDDDGQHRPEDIPALISKQQHDIVIGSFEEKQHGLSKKFFSWLKSYFDTLVLKKPKHIRLSPFRLIQRPIVEAMRTIQSSHPFIPAMMLYVTRDIVSVPATHEKRQEGKTGYSFRMMFQLFSNLMINNSSFLLKQIGRMGISISIISFLAGLFFILKKIIWGIDATGWASLMVTLLFVGGLILFSLGTIGEYLIRIISGVEAKPTYIVKDIARKQGN
jgi:glycosyltransferase involved in cell wall biosynthesis